MPSPILYFQCLSGISGDMTVACLLDLGADETVLRKGLKSLNLEGYSIEISRTQKCGISSCDFNVILEHEHNHEQYHHNHHHEHHHHEHEHEHYHHEHHQHRTIQDINTIIDNSAITDNAKAISKKIFHIVAVSESKAHNIPVEKVHFHEVGAIDSIIDITATAICIDNLDIEEFVFSPIYEGIGHVHCQHGTLPVPVPAVVNIAEKYNLPLKLTEINTELVTPTGIAIAAAFYTKKALPEQYIIIKSGIGAGKKDLPHANILRGFLIEDTSNDSDNIWCLETNIDDCTGENMGFVLQKLFDAGARDAFFTPIYMKKNRPAYCITVLCCQNQIAEMEKILFCNTTTIGIRRHAVQRTTLKREIKKVHTEYGDALVKKAVYEHSIFYYPEYQSVKELAEQNNIDFKTMYHIIICSAKQNNV